MSTEPLVLRDFRRITRGAEVDVAKSGVTLMGPAKWKDGSPKKLVWVQLAECGTWKGHPAGAFSLTPATFSEICTNFDKRGLPIPFDFEHASEMAPSDGSIPQAGAPAPGWVHRLDNRGPGGLWGLVEWLDYAREKIQAGEYGFLSPAIRFETKDAATGAAAGARLSSVALTNTPFLTNLEGLVAARETVAPDPRAAARERRVRARAATIMMSDRVLWSAAQARAASEVRQEEEREGIVDPKDREAEIALERRARVNAKTFLPGASR